MAAQENWVTESTSLIWIDPFLARADYIVLLAVPWRLAAVRIVRRHIAKSLRRTNAYTGIKALFQFLGGARDYDLKRCDAETAELMHNYLSEQATPFDSLDQEQLLYRLQTYGLAIIFAPTADFVRCYLIPYQQNVVIVENSADRARLLALLEQHSATSTVV